MRDPDFFTGSEGAAKAQMTRPCLGTSDGMFFA
jgi:hypothetical protein